MASNFSLSGLHGNFAFTDVGKAMHKRQQTTTNYYRSRGKKYENLDGLNFA